MKSDQIGSAPGTPSARAAHGHLALVLVPVVARAPRDALARLRALEQRMDRLTLPYEEWEALFRQRRQVERSALRRIAGLSDEPRPGPCCPRRTVRCRARWRRWRRPWPSERRGNGRGLVPFLSAAAVLGAKLVADQRPPAPRDRAGLPAPDAHAEARFPKAG